ncbi:MAG: shikimate kinase AroK [Gammaproteobacteria bacterium]|jgi:shikimate kinase
MINDRLERAFNKADRFSHKSCKVIFLIGPFGAGKSTIGRALAKALDLKFYDTDRIIEKRLGVDLSWIFDIEGEAGFRRRETEILDELSQLSDVIISTGGGTILLPENRRLLKDRGLVIYLKTTIKQQLQRTQRNKYNRPTLRVDNIEDCLKVFHNERAPLYGEVADVSFSTNRRSYKVVVKEILQYLEEIEF